MFERQLPVRPDLDQLKHQAKDLLRDARQGDLAAIAELRERLGADFDPASAKLADAQRALARSYGVPSWPRMVIACRMVDAIWRDDVEAVRQLVLKQPRLLHEMARGTKQCNWGPPMSYAANLGRDAIIRMLHELGATDLLRALDRASLQSRIDTARLLHELAGRPRPSIGCLGGPAYTLSATGTELMFELGAQVFDDQGKSIAPVDVVLETDSRKPANKHRILEMYVQHGCSLPDTPTMAVHRGRIDLLEAHLKRDPQLLSRTFTHEEIYPPELGCHDEVLTTQGTPLAGGTLLHLCVDYNEIEIAEWLLERGMNPDTPAAIDTNGFGGHTALFGTVVSQPNFWMNHLNLERVAPFTQLILDRGANPNARASLRKQLHPGYAPKLDVSLHEYRDVTPLGWGQQFRAKVFVSQPAMDLITAHGGEQ